MRVTETSHPFAGPSFAGPPLPGGLPAVAGGTAAAGFPVIEQVSAAVYVVPTDAPEADGTLAWDQTTMVLVTARAGGQAGTGWSYAPAASAALVNDVLAGVVAFRSAADIPAASEAMARALRNDGQAGAGAMALSAVDIALWDLKARLLGLPLASLLGQARADVPVYGSGGFTSYDDQQTRDQLADWAERDRIPRVKIKIGESRGADERRDLRRAELARSVIGPEAELYADANGGYTASQAIRVAARLAADCGVTWLEEPVSSQDLAGLAAVRRQVLPDVAAGEYSWTLADSAALIGAGAVDCLQLDVTRCGGITGFLRGAALAAAASLQVSAHCAPGLHAHPASAIPNLRHVEYFHDHQRIEGLLFDGTLSPLGGALTPDLTRPGHGLDLREADAAPYRKA
jgi:L-alanine-DL-glutamate epimerase-like enolase superfamily enzyme